MEVGSDLVAGNERGKQTSRRGAAVGAMAAFAEFLSRHVIL